LSRTRERFRSGLSTLFSSGKALDEELFNQLERQLILADVGVHISQEIIQNLREQTKLHSIQDAAALLPILQDLLVQLLAPAQEVDPLAGKKPVVILMVGVNGSGKTTSIAKLAHYYKQQGLSIILGAGDTFRAAAVEQLKTWGERNEVPVIAAQGKADSAAVLFDALSAAKSRQMDVLIADTAGRLHTQMHLMEELKKIKRVLAKQHDAQEVFLVLDATSGQNALQQAKIFNQEIGVTGLIVSKLDGTARGGIVFAIARELGIPIRFIGVGEEIEDLRAFDPKAFVAALLTQDQESTVLTDQHDC
jgi:fused signal recognition particle receptor